MATSRSIASQRRDRRSSVAPIRSRMAHTVEADEIANPIPVCLLRAMAVAAGSDYGAEYPTETRLRGSRIHSSGPGGGGVVAPGMLFGGGKRYCVVKGAEMS